MSTYRRLSTLFSFFLILLAVACQPSVSNTTPSTGDSAQTSSPSDTGSSASSTATTSPSLKTAWISDGIISPGEYPDTKIFADYELSWLTDDSFIYMGIKAKTPGWVAVGFGAETMMKNADIVEGYIADGKAEVIDMFSTGEFGPHPPDTQLGGTNDILDPSARFDNGFTTVEFKRKLDTGDKYDKPLVKGNNKIIWAFGSEPKATLKHMSRGTGEITLK